MTREEAIKTLRELWRETNDPWYEEAYDMAIEALTQDSRKVTQESTQDLISRADLFNELATVKASPEANEYKAEVYGVIQNLPSAEPKAGEWVMLERVENVHDIYGVPTWGVNYMCDKCGFIHTAIQNHFSQYKFCPNCGARMKGADDE